MEKEARKNILSTNQTDFLCSLIAPKECFLNISVHRNILESLLKHKFLATSTTHSNLVVLGQRDSPALKIHSHAINTPFENVSFSSFAYSHKVVNLSPLFNLRPFSSFHKLILINSHSSFIPCPTHGKF
jgi:hypothetical protein